MANQPSGDYPTYTEATNPATRGTQSTGASTTEKVAQAAERAKERVTEAGRGAAAKIDEKREPAADALDSAATALHDKADSLPGGESVSSMAHTAANKVGATADYVREHNVRDMMSDVEQFVKSHPGQSLVAAAAVGFLVGRAFRND